MGCLFWSSRTITIIQIFLDVKLNNPETEVDCKKMSSILICLFKCSVSEFPDVDTTEFPSSLEEPWSRCHVWHPVGWINTNNVCMLCTFTHWQLLRTGTHWDLVFIQVLGPYPHRLRLLHPLCHVLVTLQASLSENSPAASQPFIYLLFLGDLLCCSFLHLVCLLSSSSL